MDTITKADVIAEGNVKVVLPWDGRVGEIWVVDSDRDLFGLAGLNADHIPARIEFHASLDYIVQFYTWNNAEIRRAPEGAEVGDLV